MEFECAAVASGHTQDVKFVKWHPYRNQLFSASYDDTIKSWAYNPEVDDWMCHYTMDGHESTVWCKLNLIKFHSKSWTLTALVIIW